MLGSSTRPGLTPRGASDAPHGVTPHSPRATRPRCPPLRPLSAAKPRPGPHLCGEAAFKQLACRQEEPLAARVTALSVGWVPGGALGRVIVALPLRPRGRNPPLCPVLHGRGVLPAFGHPLGPTLVPHQLLCGSLPPSSALMVLFFLSLIPRRELTPPTPPVLSSQKLPFYLKQFQETQLFIPAFRFQTHPRARACRRLLQHPPSNPHFAFYFFWREVPGLRGSAQPRLGAPSRSPPRHGGWGRSSPQQDPPEMPSESSTGTAFGRSHSVCWP